MGRRTRPTAQQLTDRMPGRAETAPLAGKLGGGALGTTVSRVNLIPPGVVRNVAVTSS
ncbi:hypothetical protein AB0J35_02970 [Nonomuraea angiospora]|uniref:hypothetical protein n=1 Tax=Nonomuraea angiospora TaxID=46172 RepID=UPI003431805B